MNTKVHDLEKRRRQLGLTYSALAKRSKVSQATVVRFLSGQHPQASFQNVTAIADALGFAIAFSSTATANEIRKSQAKAKARQLVGLVQGTSGLEAQAVDAERLADMTDQAENDLLAGSSRKLWGIWLPLWTPIPGETPIDDASGLKVGGITLRRELNAYEAENILKPVIKYLSRRPSRRLAPFDYRWIKKLHWEMLGDVWDWAGNLRTTELTIGIDPIQLDPSLYEMVQNLKAQQLSDSYTLLDQSVWLHHRAVQIHPFPNGNGRWSRLLSNIWLKQNGSPIVEWPEVAVGDVSTVRDEYLNAIQRADRCDFGPLTELHRRFLAE
jgi:Fic-DOC domain mobile mystery protein B